MFFCFSVNKKGESKGKNGLLLALLFVMLVAVCLGAFAFVRIIPQKSETDMEGFGKVCLLGDTREQREEFFSQFGVASESISERPVRVPEGGEEFESYVLLQKGQGFDLSLYRGKNASEHVLKLLGKSEEGYPLYGVLTVYRGRIIAAHLTDYVYPSECLPLCILWE